MKTMSIQLWANNVVCSANQATRVVPVRGVPAALDVRAAFIQAYPTFAARCRAIDEPGVALIAIHEATGAVAGVAHVSAAVGRPVCAIVGRHDRCDLHLPQDDQLALRHVAVILSPLQSYRRGSADVSFRILDLRTTTGMFDERGRHLRGLRAEGPTFVRTAGYLICALPVGDPTDWPASAADAWACLPERVYFDERLAEGSVVDRPPMRDPNMTPIVRLNGPSEINMLPALRDEVAGRLFIEGQGAITIGRKALRDGILIGRYGRCDAADLARDDSLSRVHLLLTVIDHDRLIAIDTASTNGIRVRGTKEVRLVEVREDDELELGFHTRIRWHWSA